MESPECQFIITVRQGSVKAKNMSWINFLYNVQRLAKACLEAKDLSAMLILPGKTPIWPPFPLASWSLKR
jgi:hypothetical protein